MTDLDSKLMQSALESAVRAGRRGEVPVGACVVNADNVIIAAAGNRTISDNDPTAHAEILAIRRAAQKTGNYRLTGCAVYTTIEPCVMCAGALVNARVSRLIFGASDERYGAVRTQFDLCDNEVLNHRIDVVAGVLEEECRSLMKNFFKAKR